jgi:hypothetical protein
MVAYYIGQSSAAFRNKRSWAVNALSRRPRYYFHSNSSPIRLVSFNTWIHLSKAFQRDFVYGSKVIWCLKSVLRNGDQNWVRCAMAAPGLWLKRVLNEIHNELHHTVLPLRIQPPSRLLFLLNMPSLLGLGGVVGRQQLVVIRSTDCVTTERGCQP